MLQGKFKLCFETHKLLFRPDASKEDDGVLIIRALDIAENKGLLFLQITLLSTGSGVLLIIDATTMSEIGRAYVPISIPFGFHNRFFSKRELGIPEGFQAGVYGASETKREKFLKPTTLPPSASSETNFWARLISTTKTSTLQFIRHSPNYNV